MTTRLHVPAGSGRATLASAGQTLRIINLEGRQVASDNFLEALAAWGVQRHQLPQPVNRFQNMAYPGGRVEFRESLAKPGDTVELRALMDVVAAVSACPMDLNPISGYRVTDIAIEVA